MMKLGFVVKPERPNVRSATPVVRVNNKRHGLSVISTVTNKGTMRWKIVVCTRYTTE